MMKPFIITIVGFMQIIWPDFTVRFPSGMSFDDICLNPEFQTNNTVSKKRPADRELENEGFAPVLDVV